MTDPKRPTQVLFYPSDEVKEIFATKLIEKGDRTEFINEAIVAYAERKAGGALYALEQAYETLRFIATPEAEAVRASLREIIWRRSDTPDSVIVRIHMKDGTIVVDQFVDFEKAILIALARPTAMKMEIYDKQNKLLMVGIRTAEDTFSWT